MAAVQIPRTPSATPHAAQVRGGAGLPIAITQGDVAGIGPEIVAKTFRDAPHLTAGCFIVGDIASMRRAAACISAQGAMALPVVQIAQPHEAWQMPPGCLPVLSISKLENHIPYGFVSDLAGKMAHDCVQWAARAALAGQVAAVVTAPLHKEALAAAGISFPGHTELLQAEAAQHLGLPVAQVPVRMMLANDELRVVLVSIHMSLRDALDALTQPALMQTLQITHAALRRSLGRVPRIAVAGLNPHAGEGGLFGREEIDIIAPVVAAARAQGLDVAGPFAPDTVFMRARQTPARSAEFDVVIAMYHDQGLIPVKYLGVEHGVNVTLGLPLVRTSPDHGTAFDIAGTGKADASSMMAALRVARDMAGMPA